MKNDVITSFEFDNEQINADKYTADLQECFDKLEHLITYANEYALKENNEQYPLWEYVDREDDKTLFYIIADLIYMNGNADLYGQINKLIKKFREDR